MSALAGFPSHGLPFSPRSTFFFIYNLETDRQSSFSLLLSGGGGWAEGRQAHIPTTGKQFLIFEISSSKVVRGCVCSVWEWVSWQKSVSVLLVNWLTRTRINCFFYHFLKCSLARRLVPAAASVVVQVVQGLVHVVQLHALEVHLVAQKTWQILTKNDTN